MAGLLLGLAAPDSRDRILFRLGGPRFPRHDFSSPRRLGIPVTGFFFGLAARDSRDRTFFASEARDSPRQDFFFGLGGSGYPRQDFFWPQRANVGQCRAVGCMEYQGRKRQGLYKHFGNPGCHIGVLGCGNVKETLGFISTSAIRDSRLGYWDMETLKKHKVL